MQLNGLVPNVIAYRSAIGACVRPSSLPRPVLLRRWLASSRSRLMTVRQMNKEANLLSLPTSHLLMIIFTFPRKDRFR